MSVEKAKNALAKVKVRPMSTEVAEIRKNINMIQEAMQATFKKDIHYGVIPGCGKPSLYKAGAESLIALFKLTFRPEPMPVDQVEGEVRYLIRMDLLTRDGIFIGSGIGECSSGEEKYSWRAAVCEEEFEVTPEHRRRIKFRKNKYKGGEVEQIQQVRVPASDMANTILKMAKKRALIDAVLTATAASDIFSQDIEDLPEGYIAPEEVVDKLVETVEKVVEAAQKDPEIMDHVFQGTQQEAPAPKREGQVISEPQRKRLFAIAMGAGMEKEGFSEWLSFNYNYGSSQDILRADYEKICADAEATKE